MTTTYIGTTFPKTFQWHIDEVTLIDNIKNQINTKYPNVQNLFINTTWFGPQFNNGEYEKLIELIKQKKQFTNLFMLAAADPVFLNSDQIANIVAETKSTNVFLLGHFDSTYQFNFHSTVLLKYFKSYITEELYLTDLKWVFLNYNRKPREHRTELVQKIVDANLKNFGVMSLGKNDKTYSKQENELCLLLGETIEEYKEGNWGMPDTFGIPHDIHTLGNMEIWRTHFLTVVSETEFWPWDNTFVSEKTWKPIIGLRPFLLNGQTTVYSWLRNNGFKTFNHYFNGIELENIKEFEVHDSIIAVIKYLTTLDKTEISEMYNDMLPDLKYNQNRFFEFAKEQKYKTEHLFD
jgi:hypothetical protein